jgi:hypothetical protein
MDLKTPDYYYSLFVIGSFESEKMILVIHACCFWG